MQINVRNNTEVQVSRIMWSMVGKVFQFSQFVALLSTAVHVLWPEILDPDVAPPESCSRRWVALLCSAENGLTMFHLSFSLQDIKPKRDNFSVTVCSGYLSSVILLQEGLSISNIIGANPACCCKSYLCLVYRCETSHQRTIPYYWWDKRCYETNQVGERRISHQIAWISEEKSGRYREVEGP